METREMPAPVEQGQVSQSFDVLLRIPVARYILKGTREKYNSSLAELTTDHSDLGDEKRADFQESDLARLVRGSVDRLYAAEADKVEAVTLNLTANDAKIIRDNSKPTTDPADIMLNRAMFEEFNGAILDARRKKAKGVFEKAKIILGL